MIEASLAFYEVGAAALAVAAVAWLHQQWRGRREKRDLAARLRRLEEAR